MHIGIVGGGFVGSATALLKCKDINVTTYDLDPSRCNPPGTLITDLKSCDFVFVCVPTPSYEDGKCNTTIVQKCIASLRHHNIQNIVLRSIVPPGMSESLGVSFMPEFLTEANWKNDFFNCKQWVLGAKSEEDKIVFRHLILLAKNNNVISNDTILFTGRNEAELIKYTRNNFLALKISFFNEINALCKAKGIDYESVREGIAGDPRIGISHTGVPGYDGHYGFGGTCLPKDTNSLLTYMTESKVESYIVKAMVNRNSIVDRPEKDWQNDPRAFVREKKN
jgi:UDPglucose 6-dehydrogenase